MDMPNWVRSLSLSGDALIGGLEHTPEIHRQPSLYYTVGARSVQNRAETYRPYPISTDLEGTILLLEPGRSTVHLDRGGMYLSIPARYENAGMPAVTYITIPDKQAYFLPLQD